MPSRGSTHSSSTTQVQRQESGGIGPFGPDAEIVTSRLPSDFERAKRRVESAMGSALSYLRFVRTHPTLLETVRSEMETEASCYLKAWELWCSPEGLNRAGVRKALRAWTLETYGVKRAFTFACLNDWLFLGKLPASIQLRGLKPLHRPKDSSDFYYLLGAYAAHGSTEPRHRAISFWAPRETPWLKKLALIIGTMTQRDKPVEACRTGHKVGFSVRSQSSALHYALARPLLNPKRIVETQLKTPERRLAFLRGYFDVAIPLDKARAHRIGTGGTDKRATLLLVARLLSEFGVHSRIYSYVVKPKPQERASDILPQHPRKFRYAQHLLIADPQEIRRFLDLNLLSDPQLKRKLRSTARPSDSPHVRYSAELYSRVVSAYRALQTQNPDWSAARLTNAVRRALGAEAPSAQLVGNWTRRNMSPLAAKRACSVVEQTALIQTGAASKLGILPGARVRLPMRQLLDALGPITTVAPQLGCSASHLLEVYLGKRPPSPHLKQAVHHRLGLFHDAVERVGDSTKWADYLAQQGYPLPVRVALGLSAQQEPDPELALQRHTKQSLSELKQPRSFVEWDVQQLTGADSPGKIGAPLSSTLLLLAAARYLSPAQAGAITLAHKSTEYERFSKTDIQRAEQILEQLDTAIPTQPRPISDKKTLLALDLLLSLPGLTSSERKQALQSFPAMEAGGEPRLPEILPLSTSTVPWKILPVDCALILELQGRSELMLSFGAAFSIRARELCQLTFRSRERAFQVLWDQITLWAQAIESRTNSRPAGFNSYWAYRG